MSILPVSSDAAEHQRQEKGREGCPVPPCLARLASVRALGDAFAIDRPELRFEGLAIRLGELQ